MPAPKNYVPVYVRREVSEELKRMKKQLEDQISEQNFGGKGGENGSVEVSYSDLVLRLMNGEKDKKRKRQW